MRIAALASPEAAGGKAASLAGQLGQALKGRTICAVKGWGGEAIGGTLLKAEPSGQGYVASLEAAVEALYREQPDAYVLLGGDGLAAYAAQTLLRLGAKQPVLIGLAGGTANVGPIVSMTVDEFAARGLETLSFTPCDALEALSDTGRLALGFNDLVLGNTLLATVRGQAVTIDALALAGDGARIPARPMERIASQLRVLKNGQPVPLGQAAPAQAVLSAISGDRTYGRAVLGALCCAAGEGHAAALSLLAKPVITFEPLAAGFSEFMNVSQLLFGPGDELEISGLLEGVCLIADGNPYPLDQGVLKVRMLQDAVRIVERSGAA